MQEEVTQKTVTFCIRATKITADLLKRAYETFSVKQYLEGSSMIKQNHRRAFYYGKTKETCTQSTNDRW